MDIQKTSIQQSALAWVRKAIDDYLSDIRRNLNRYQDDYDDALIKEIRHQLVLINGVLTMVEQFGAAMLSEEMVTLCGFLIAEDKNKKDQPLEVLLRAVLQLPDYIERIQAGLSDLPLVILPLLNDIRAIQNKELFSEKLLFLPNISRPSTNLRLDLSPENSKKSQIYAKKTRPAYLFSLLNLIKGKDINEQFIRLNKITAVMEERSHSEDLKQFWIILAALIESLSRADLEIGVAIKMLLGKVDSVFKLLIESGEAAYIEHWPTELIKNLLYYVAQPECAGPKSLAVKIAYQLDQHLPNEKEREKIMGAINGPNKALLNTVGESVKNDIETVKSMLEVYINGDLSDIARLSKVPEELHIISATLGMVGMGAQGKIIESKRVLVQSILDGHHRTSKDEILLIAKDLLLVEDGLDNINKIQNARQIDEKTPDSDFEFDSTLSAVVRATLDDFKKIKTAILDYIKDHTKAENLALCASLLNESKGAMDILGKSIMSRVMQKLSFYIKEYDASFLSAKHLELFSDVIISIELFLEALGEKRSDIDTIEQLSESKLNNLLEYAAENLAVLPTNLHPVEESIENKAALSAPQDKPSSENSTVRSISHDLDEIHEVLEPINHAIDGALSSRLYPLLQHLKITPIASDVIVLAQAADPDILEVYIEEAEAESLGIKNNFRLWENDLKNDALLKSIRRSFHTIKGSGRLVGALLIAELAQDFEELLNRLLAHTLPINPDIVQSIAYVAEALPEFVEQIKSKATPLHDLAYLRGAAQLLAVYGAAATGQQSATAVKQVASSPKKRDVEDSAVADNEEELLELDPDDGLEEVADSAMTAISPSLEAIQPDSGSTAGEDPDPFVVSSSVFEPIAMQKWDASPKNPSKKELSYIQEASIDSDLFAIYQQEVQAHISQIFTFLDDLSIEKIFDPTPIYRSLHTINGASKTAGIISIGEFAAVMDKPLRNFCEDKKIVFEHDVHQLYMQGATQLSLMVNALEGTLDEPSYSNELLEAFEKIQIKSHKNAQNTDNGLKIADQNSAEPDSAEPDSAEPDNELIAIFLEEADEILNASDAALFKWKSAITANRKTDSINTIMEIQRYLHTLKGGARMASFKPIADVSHELESLFIDVLDSRVETNVALMDVLHGCFDLLASMVEAAENKQAIPEYAATLATINAIRKGEDVADNVANVVADVVADVVAEQKPILAVVEDSVVEDSVADDVQKTKEIIKVRSDLLDNLVNAAGEVSIYRSRMQQQVVLVNTNLGELDQTIARLKRQLRHLEAETDAQIRYSHKDSDKNDENYDPLEMDHYTKMQELSKSLAESVEDLSSLRSLMGEQLKDLETLLQQQSRINSDLQDGLIRSRMVKFSGLVPRLRRIVRQASSALSKKIELKLMGENNEIDNKVLDRMLSPLEHLLRNAIAHGIETPVERVKKGKPETGLISIEIKRENADIVIIISDDGGGIDKEKIRRRALQLGLISDLSQVQDQDLLRLILEPGFSTEEQITQISGRGIGMDVVDTEIKQLGGSLNISSEAGKGSSFIAKLPFTLSVNQAILVDVGEESFVIPMNNVEGITRMSQQQLTGLYAQENPTLAYADNRYELHYLASLLGVNKKYNPANSDEKFPVLLARSGETRIALHIDNIVGNREIVVKPLGKQLSQVKSLSGASILGDGRIVLILDVSGLVTHGINTSVDGYELSPDDSIKQSDDHPTIMVVDDSIAMRRVAQKLLERNNFEVITAKDGIEALSQLSDMHPDVMLLDIEMPRMDGFELATHIKKDDGLNKIPIIMVTSRTGEKHRNHAKDIGVERYMGKPYQEAELLENINQLLEIHQQ